MEYVKGVFKVHDFEKGLLVSRSMKEKIAFDKSNYHYIKIEKEKEKEKKDKKNEKEKEKEKEKKEEDINTAEKIQKAKNKNDCFEDKKLRKKISWISFM